MDTTTGTTGIALPSTWKKLRCFAQYNDDTIIFEINNFEVNFVDGGMSLHSGSIRRSGWFYLTSTSINLSKYIIASISSGSVVNAQSVESQCTVKVFYQ